MDKFSQLKLLIWKNLLIQKRHKLATAFEIGLPIIATALVVLIRHFIKEEVQCETNPALGGFCDYALFTPALFPIIPPCTDLNCILNVAYTPNDTNSKRLMGAVENYYGLKTRGFATEPTMVKFLKDRDNNSTSEDVDAKDSNWLGGIVFNTTDPHHIEYSIRLDAVPRLAAHSDPPVNNWKTWHVYPIFQVIGPREINNSFGGAPGYFREGFLALQHAIDRAIIMNATKRFPTPVVMKRMPYPRFEFDQFVYILENTLPFLFLIAFLALNINCVKGVVTEKEKRIKEAMKIMGLSGWVHWVAWYIEIIMIMIIPVIGITIMMQYGYIIQWSDPTLVFTFILFYVLSSISFSFLVSTLFSRANVAAGASGVFWFLNYAPYFFLQQFYAEYMSFEQKLGVSVFSNTAMSIGFKILGAHESAEVGVQWSNFLDDRATGDLPFGSIILVLIFDMFLYIILAWYIENVWPGEFGMPKKWYFPLTPSYWGFCQSQHLSDMIINETTPLVTESSAVQNRMYYEDVSPNLDPVVDVRNLTKQYSGKTVKAVDGLNLKLYRGQIFSLLGHNGAGKTTTISLLTGLYEPTKGTAYIMGRDIRTSIQAIRKQIGYCPQYNVLFDELSVEQHLIFFSYLKGAGSTMRYDVDQMIKSLNLEDKRHELSCNLSGGMKRKLSCANALIGNSKIVFLDEPTSGMDPAARRSTWDLLLKYKEDKTIILTTHFMDEADLLGDRIGIMAKGNLCCVGSSMFLKKQFGIGYHMTAVKREGFQTEPIVNFVLSYIPGSKLEGDLAAEVSFLLPEEQISNFERFFSELEREQENLGIETYGLSITTLEEVFMRVEEMGQGDKSPAIKVASDIFSKARKNLADMLHGDSKSLPANDTEVNTKRSRAVQIRDHFNTGKTLALQQMRAMLMKRCFYSLRNFKTLLMQLLMPMIFTMIPLIVIKMYPAEKPLPALNLTVLNQDNMFPDSYIMYDPGNSSMMNNLMKNVGELTAESLPAGLTDIRDSSDNMTHYILDKIRKLHGNFDKDYIFGFSSLDHMPHGQDVTMLWFNNRPYHTIPIALNLYTNAYLRMNNVNLTVSAINKPLPPTAIDKVKVNLALFAFGVSFNVMFGFAFLASSFVIFVVKERVSGTRHLQMLSGLSPTIYWVSTFLWDIVNFLVPSLLMLVLFQVFGVDAFMDDNLSIVLLLELLYGWAIIPLMYLMSNLFKNEILAYTYLIMANVLSGTGAITILFILSIPSFGLVHVADALLWVFLFLPTFNLGKGLGDLYVNYTTKKACTENFFTKLACKAQGIVWQDNFLAWDSPGIGRYLIWLALSGICFHVIVLLLEYLNVRKFKKRVRIESGSSHVHDQHENQDVKLERERVAGSSASDYAVRVSNLTKTYATNAGKQITAVDHMSVGIPSKETFGLLGVNGAGKTSTFKMLTGDLPISSGSATICGYDITEDLRSARQYIGYCPQFDALIDCMTPKEHLVMYARLRGVPEGALDRMVERTLTELSLTNHADYYSYSLSGGNKRRLATAIAVVGYPPVVFLDEPTSGLDIAARRSLWDVVCKVRRLGTAVILTSHSMEECEALCTRLAIMVNGQLKCIGTLQELKSRYGAGYNVQVKVQSDSSGEPDKTALLGFMRCHFPNATLEEEHQGLLSYIIPKARNISWSQIFSLLEANKQQARIQDYSVSQTTLEQVFLSFAKAQRSEDD